MICSRIRLGSLALGLAALVNLVAPATAADTADDHESQTGTSPLAVWVSIPPLAFFVERIGGDLVTVDVVLAPGASPAAYDPTAQQMASLAEAQLFVGIGVPLERRLWPHVRRLLPAAAIVQADEGITFTEAGYANVAPADPTAARDEGTDDSSPDHHEHHGEYDPHIWLSPRLAVTIAQNVCHGLVRNDPTNTATYQLNLEDLEADLAALAAEMGQILAPVSGRDLIVFHPAFGYLAADYGLHQVAIEQGGLAPSPRHLAEILDRIEASGEKVIFLQPQFSQATAQAVAEAADVELVILDPLRRDYLENLSEMARTIHRTLTRE